MQETGIVAALLGIIGVIIGLAVVIVVLIAFFDMWLSLRSIRRETASLSKMLRLVAIAASGQSLVGRIGMTQGMVNPHSASGQVIIDSEYWNCWSETTIPAGTKVKVKAIVGLNLCVEAVSVPNP